MKSINKICCLGTALAAVLTIATPAHAQLALSYKLDVRTPRAEQPEVAVNPCTALNWMTSIGTCGRELLARVAHAGRPDNLAVFESAPGSAQGELPELGRPERELRLLRSAGGKETLLANSKTADLLLRIGSKFRLRGADEGGWEWYRFSDVTYDNHVKVNGHKSVGVELVVPFQ